MTTRTCNQRRQQAMHGVASVPCRGINYHAQLRRHDDDDDFHYSACSSDRVSLGGIGVGGGAGWPGEEGRSIEEGRYIELISGIGYARAGTKLPVKKKFNVRHRQERNTCKCLQVFRLGPLVRSRWMI